MIFESRSNGYAQRDFAEYVLSLVRSTEAEVGGHAELCLDGDEWVVECERTETRLILGVRVMWRPESFP